MALRDRSKMKKQLQKRTKESYNRKDFGGGGKTVLNLGSGVKKWPVSEDDHEIDIIPFEVGKNYPTPPSVSKDEIPKEGDYHYVLDFWEHSGMGPSKRDRYLCLEATYGLPCPICEKMNDLLEEGYDYQDDIIKKMKPKRRVAYNIWSHDSKKAEKEGVQVLEIAHFFMEKHLAEQSRDPKKGGHIAFSDPDDGKTVFFTKKGSGMNQEYSGFRFYDREEPIPDEILDQAVCLDDCLTLPTYEELQEVLEVSYKVKEEDAEASSEGKEQEKSTDKKEEKAKVEEKQDPEPEEEEYTADDIREMSLKELKELVSESEELDFSTKKYKKKSDREELAEKIIDELGLESEENEEEGEVGGEEEEGYTADEIRELSLDELKELVSESEDLDINTKKYKKKADAKKLAEKIIEELGLEEEEFGESEDEVPF